MSDIALDFENVEAFKATLNELQREAKKGATEIPKLLINFFWIHII